MGDHSSRATATTEGDLLVVCAVVSTALYTVFVKQLLGKYNVATVLLWVYAIATVIVLPFGIAEATTTDFGVWDHRGIISFVVVLCFLTYLPNALYNYALHHIEPFRTSIFSYIQPVAAIVLSSILRLDTLRLPTMCFAVLIFVGIGIVLSSYHSRPSRQ
jgi:drug/metabolite transporter (DMT)-like permease